MTVSNDAYGKQGESERSIMPPSPIRHALSRHVTPGNGRVTLCNASSLATHHAPCYPTPADGSSLCSNDPCGSWSYLRIGPATSVVGPVSLR